MPIKPQAMATVRSIMALPRLLVNFSTPVQQNFVKVVRAVELILGIPIPGEQLTSKLTTTNFTSAMPAMMNSSSGGLFNDEVKSVLEDAAPILTQIAFELVIPTIFDITLPSAPVHNQRAPLTTK